MTAATEHAADVFAIDVFAGSDTVALADASSVYHMMNDRNHFG